MIAKATFPHRGRMQAQGGRGRGIQESESWAQQEPLAAIDGHNLLDALCQKLAPADRDLREQAFAQAHGFVDESLRAGGIGPTKQTFPRGKISAKNGRVDIEVHKGLAFVATPG